MPEQAPQSLELLEQKKEELHQNYLNALQNLINGDLEAKRLFLVGWSIKDKLISDFFTLSLVTLGVAVTVLTAGPELIRTQLLFSLALTLLVAVVVFASITRIILSQRISKINIDIYQEYTKRQNKIDSYRINPIDENKGRMEEVISQSEFSPNESWLTKSAGLVIVVGYIFSFLLMSLALIFKISF
ncbi:hypothetical protein BH09PAT4_BH09PAT4_06400 [soil metagenome]